MNVNVSSKAVPLAGYTVQFLYSGGEFAVRIKSKFVEIGIKFMSLIAGLILTFM